MDMRAIEVAFEKHALTEGLQAGDRIQYDPNEGNFFGEFVRVFLKPEEQNFSVYGYTPDILNEMAQASFELEIGFDEYMDNLYEYDNDKKVQIESGLSKALDEIQNSDKNIAASMALSPRYNRDTHDKTMSNGTEISPRHAYSVSRVTQNSVYLVNPEDSTEVLEVPRIDVLKDFSLIIQKFGSD